MTVETLATRFRSDSVGSWISATAREANVGSHHLRFKAG
jgi:hypothetical protein